MPDGAGGVTFLPFLTGERGGICLLLMGFVAILTSLLLVGIVVYRRFASTGT